MRASHSKLSTFRRCRRKYNWSYNYNKDTGSSPGQIIGTLGHSALAYWYTHRDSPAAHVDTLIRAEAAAHDIGVPRDDIARLQRALTRYFEYAQDLDVFDVTSTEKKVTKQVGNHTLEGYVDMIATLPDGKQVAFEHKFQKQPDISNVALDTQIDMYLFLADVDCVTFNVINVTTAVNTKTAPVLRETVSRTPEHMSMFLRNLQAQLDNMAEYDSHPRKDHYAYPTPIKDCKWDCGFYSTCAAYQNTGDFSLVQDLPEKSFFREDGVTK